MASATDQLMTVCRQHTTRVNNPSSMRHMWKSNERKLKTLHSHVNSNTDPNELQHYTDRWIKLNTDTYWCIDRQLAGPECGQASVALGKLAALSRIIAFSIAFAWESWLLCQESLHPHVNFNTNPNELLHWHVLTAEYGHTLMHWPPTDRPTVGQASVAFAKESWLPCQESQRSQMNFNTHPNELQHWHKLTAETTWAWTRISALTAN